LELVTLIPIQNDNEYYVLD